MKSCEQKFHIQNYDLLPFSVYCHSRLLLLSIYRPSRFTAALDLLLLSIYCYSQFTAPLDLLPLSIYCYSRFIAPLDLLPLSIYS